VRLKIKPLRVMGMLFVVFSEVEVSDQMQLCSVDFLELQLRCHAHLHDYFNQGVKEMHSKRTIG
jgi:hypothetical protein